MIHFLPALLSILRCWKCLTDIGTEGSPPADTITVFRNHRGEPMTRFGVRYLLRHYAERACSVTPTLASKRVHPHTYRHSAAVHLLRAGLDLVGIRLCHKKTSIETTNRYAAIDLETKREALQRAGPLAGSVQSDT